MRKFVSIIFYGNLFYGLCALALCLEANLQHNLQPNGPHFYFLVFAITVVYYTRIYYKSRGTPDTNERSALYNTYGVYIKTALNILLTCIVVDAIIVIIKFKQSALLLQHVQWYVLLAFPVIAFLYTYKTLPLIRNKQLRNIGWLKPFFIGFAWSGLVSVYPILFRQMQSRVPASLFKLPSGLFWFQNFLFISALAIIFDIKDHESDSKFGLQTYPALLGVQKTLRLVVVPITLVSMGTLFLYLSQQHSSIGSYLLQAIPYVLLLGMTRLVNRNTGILFYLVAIDGLMLLKGLFGIISTIL